MAAIGDVDEANSAIGVACAQSDDERQVEALRRIQNDLFDLGADLATPAVMQPALRIIRQQVERLEREIDVMNTTLQPLASFILPGGTRAAAALHVARAVVRRAERAVASLGPEINPQALAYLNRVSDWLFVAARITNEGEDVLWRPAATR